MEKMNLRDLKKILLGLSQDEVISDIMTLYKYIPAVKEYYIAKFYPEEESALLDKYKKIINDEYFPKRGMGKFRAAVVRKAINDFKKIAKSPENVVELMFFHVSVGVNFTNQYGDITENFYISLETSFEQALKYCKKHAILDSMEEKAELLQQKCQGFGWGFSDTIDDIFLNYYGEEDEEIEVVE